MVGEGGGSSDVTVSTSDQFLEMFAFPTSLANGLVAGRGFAGILVMILAASLIGSEYGWGALRTVLTKGTGRWSLLASKLLLLTGLSAGALIVATAALGVSSVIALTTLDANWIAAFRRLVRPRQSGSARLSTACCRTLRWPCSRRW